MSKIDILIGGGQCRGRRSPFAEHLIHPLLHLASCVVALMPGAKQLVIACLDVAHMRHDREAHAAEDRAALLGHANQSMVGHYASADVGRLLREANLVLNRQETRTVLRVANG